MPATLISIHPLGDPENAPNEAEARVAEALLKLGDGFLIRWGFYYANENGTVQGEGDFLVLGPDGNVLHIEVKGGRCGYDPETGRWDTSDGKSPIDQRDKIWEQVLGMLKRQAPVGNRREPLVDRMLALPEVEVPQTVPVYQKLPRSGLLDMADLNGIREWWNTHFQKKRKDVEERRAVFLEVFAPYLQTGVSKHVLTLTEKAIERHTVARFELLDALVQNRQFLFRGGPGTGKTWFALEQAFRWAKDGKRVLLLCFNLHLADMLKGLVAAKKAGPIEVISYEALALWLYEQAGEAFPTVDQADRDAAKRFYEVEMPRNLREIVGLLGDDQKFDALVVDEAQDHDTRYHPDVGASEEAPGWWELYADLLRDGVDAPVALFYDRFQRHHGRQPGDFQPERLLELFPKLVRIRLKRTMRYTRQILDFLKLIEHPEIAELLFDMDFHTPVPDGPEPVVLKASTAGNEKSVVGKLVGEWCKKGECRPEDVLILYPTSACRPQWLNEEKIVGFPLAGPGRSGGIRSSSVHKAKGLEAQAVILTGLPPREKVFAADGPKGLPFTWFMGANRARQMLAVIERTDLDAATVRTM
jgi:hypothetical protein